MKSRNYIFWVIILSLFSCVRNNDVKNNKNIIENDIYLQNEIEQINTIESIDIEEIIESNTFEEYVVEVIEVDRPYSIEAGEHYILAYQANILDLPDNNGNVTGQLRLNDKIIIIENMGNEQRINGFLQYWYKIKYMDLEGYIWGGYVAVETFVYDIDNNGIDDYFHYRISGVIDNKNIIHRNDDTFIYINNKIIKSDFGVHDKDSDIPWKLSIWNVCQIDLFKENGYPEGVGYYFKILDYDYHPQHGPVVAFYSHCIDKYGKIWRGFGGSTHSYWH
jgi:hypothetical protein